LAGIGFELRKALKGKTIGTFFTAMFSGIIIVAGPWLISIITISLIYRFLGPLLGGYPEVFMGPVVYSYAFSLFLFGGIHFLFTRTLSDLIFTKMEKEATYLLLIVLSITFSVTFFIAFLVMLPTYPPVGKSGLYKFAASFLFASVNCIWFLIIHISLLKRYLQIVAVYAGGMTASFLFIYFLGKIWGIAGALLGFAIGHFVIVFLLLFISARAYPPQTAPLSKLVTKKMISAYKFLGAAGAFYYGGLWIDKFLYWLKSGDPITGTCFILFPLYDIAVYVSNLTIIPGLVYFMVFSETNFYTELRKFLMSLQYKRYGIIQKHKYRLIRSIKTNVVRQSIFQAAVTISCILVLPVLFKDFFIGQTTIPIFYLSLIGVFFLLLLLTLLNLLFYMERYREAGISAFTFFMLNTVVTLFHCLAIPMLPGTGFLAGAVGGDLIAYIFLIKSSKKIDRSILAGI